MFPVRRTLNLIKLPRPKYNVPLIKFPKPLKFEEVPYHEQYETRDFVFTEKDIKRYELNCLR